VRATRFAQSELARSACRAWAPDRLVGEIAGRPEPREDRQALHRAVERGVHGGGEGAHGLDLRALALEVLGLPVQIEQERSEETDRHDADKLQMDEVPPDGRGASSWVLRRSLAARGRGVKEP
jgi:hypothetical protein